MSDVTEGWSAWFTKMDLLTVNLFITAYCARPGDARRNLKDLLDTFDVVRAGASEGISNHDPPSLENR